MSQQKYDVALSFAGEDRIHAEILANLLRSANVSVFYDNDEQSELWGEDLYTTLADIYSNKSMYCVMFLSKYYAEKSWTRHERRFAQERAFIDNHAYILPIKLDDTAIPGIPITIASIDLRTSTIEEVFRTLVKKIEISKKKFREDDINLFELNESEIKEHINKYKENISNNIFISKSYFSLGISYLLLNLYDLSTKYFNNAIEMAPEDPDCYYYYALSLIKGRRLKTLRLNEIRKIQELVNTAIQIGSKAKYFYLSAIISFDYYSSNGLKAPEPSYNESINNAKNAIHEPNEIKVLLDHVKVRDDNLTRIILGN